jgi:Na+-driven multidrug efflux pump
MKTFNAFQSILMFALMPFGISWLSEQAFRGAGIAFWAACVGYIVAFCLNVAAVRVALDHVDKL